MTATSTEGQADYSLLDYLAIARKRWLWFLVPILLLGGAATYYTLNQPDRYRATARVLIADSEVERIVGSGSQNAGFLNRALSNEVSLAESDVVKRAVEAELGELPTVAISAADASDVLIFTAVAGSADVAALNAQTWADQYIEAKRSTVLTTIDTAIEALSTQLTDLENKLTTAREPLVTLENSLNSALASDDQPEVNRLERQISQFDRREINQLTTRADSVAAQLTELEIRRPIEASSGQAQIIQDAVAPTNSINPPLSRNVGVAILLGAAIGAALALMAELRDNTIKSASDVQTITDIPVLASVPLATSKEQDGLSVSTHRDPEGKFAEAYHRVRSAIEFASYGDDEVKSVLVTSPHAAEGKSTTSSNLALALSLVGKRTVLLDLDYRRARIHNIYQIRQNPGLSDFILYGAELSDVAYSVQEEGLEDLLVVPTGTVPPNPAAFVGSGGFLQTLDWLKGQADMIVLDAPPMLAVSDVHTLGNHADAVVVVIRASKTTKAELVEVLTGLERSGARILGIVLVGVDDAETYGRYYYYSRVESESSGRRVGELWGGRSSNGASPQAPQVPASLSETQN